MTRLDPNGSDFKGPKKVMNLGPSISDLRKKGQDEVTDESQGKIKTAASYGDRARSRATKNIKRGGPPLGGAPPIPPEKTRAMAGAFAPKPSFDEEEAPQVPAAPQGPPAELPPPDPSTLPPVSGVGSGYEFNQKMAAGKISSPMSVRKANQMAAEERSQERKPLSEESVAALEEAQVQEAQRQEKQEDVDIEDAAEKAELDAAEEEMIQDIGTMFDFSGMKEVQEMLAGKERRKHIEDQLEPLDIADMITKREIQQVIPIVAGQLTYTLRTFNQHEHLFCLQYVYENPGSQAYANEMLNTCKLVCALLAINGAPLPDHRENVGKREEKVTTASFEKKLFHVASFPTQMMADLSLQAIWFNRRVNELFSLDTLKNG